MSGWKNKIKAFLGVSNELNEAFFEDLSDLLVEGDFGAALALKTAEELEARCKKEKIHDGEGAKTLLAAMLLEFLSAGFRAADFRAADSRAAAPPLDTLLAAPALNVILLLGVNGVGKTTTAAKLAALYKNNKPILAAGDTFRAAAVDQLKIHGERLGVRVVAHKQNAASHADAAAVVHDALEAALHGGYNPVIADTAGRMHTKSALVAELAKISRVVEKFAPSGQDTPACANGAAAGINYKKILVLDATTGSNAVSQAAVFNEAVKLDGVILTKFDSTARGGVVFPLAVQFNLPVLFVCSGERYEDIAPFDAQKFVDMFLAMP